ncbi:hypothetical protein ACH5RR_033237 [Cinchona calisaya]|uniref:Uncharacterized protein n=1 Tax=Cinchona calisaya TaxID=153742 RepID=A0ABD2YNX8_9GENT
MAVDGTDCQSPMLVVGPNDLGHGIPKTNPLSSSIGIVGPFLNEPDFMEVDGNIGQKYRREEDYEGPVKEVDARSLKRLRMQELHPSSRLPTVAAVAVHQDSTMITQQSNHSSAQLVKIVRLSTILSRNVGD